MEPPALVWQLAHRPGKGDDYASGVIENPRIANELGLLALPLRGGELVDLRSESEPYRRPDPYAPLWRKLTAKPRAGFRMDPIAWGRRRHGARIEI
jgi:hypothetical protein